ncbi:hypothetical protein CHS0354_006044, partial [Potamilus streckersoni]
MAASTTSTRVPTTFISSPITMVSPMHTATNMVSKAFITRQITLTPPVYVMSAILSNITTVLPTKREIISLLWEGIG